MQESSPPLQGLDEHKALRAILEGTATETGERFFAALVKSLSQAMNTYAAWVTEYMPESRRLRALAFWLGDDWLDEWEMEITGTPCEQVIENAKLIHFPDNILALYPDEPDVKAMNAVSYMGVPLLDVEGTVMGHMAVMDQNPMPADDRVVAIFRIFAARAAAELQRIRAEAEIREREEKLGRLVGSAMDAIIELADDLTITSLNPAAEKVFQSKNADIKGVTFTRFLSETDYDRLTRLVGQLNQRPEGERYLWIPGGLHAVRPSGETFPAEASLSSYDMHGRTYYTLILRDVNDRLEAEERIRTLTVQTEYLKEELQELHNFDEIIGRSDALINVLEDVKQVADTDATVLILGETGTGKEVLARAIHDSRGRRNRPLIKVNCAAIPASLMESEFFGHEKGAYTGATEKREGRFSLANGGTIFLDEVGELSVDLQVKLLRVLQEGEFEPVGSSQTRKVDVRVLAATNRDLGKAVEEGEFREDLYYRLNVFPLEAPPLRERGDDVILLAKAFMERFAQRMGRRVEELSNDAVRRLKAYHWPGNVRELENVIERAVITARDGRLNLDRALPEAASSAEAQIQSATVGEEFQIRTMGELQELERQNIVRALEASDWRVSGDKGAAQLLGMNPSTLSSRIKALGIARPKSV